MDPSRSLRTGFNDGLRAATLGPPVVADLGISEGSRGGPPRSQADAASIVGVIGGLVDELAVDVGGERMPAGGDDEVVTRGRIQRES